MKLVEGRAFDTDKTREKRKDRQEDTIVTETGDDDIECIEKGEGIPHITHVNKILHSIYSNAELYINNHQIYNSNGLDAQKCDIANNFPSTLADNKGVLHCEVYDFEEDPEHLLEVPFLTRRMKLYSRPDGFLLYGGLVIDRLTILELLYPNIKIQFRLIRAWPNFYMISDNPNVCWVLWTVLSTLGEWWSKNTFTEREWLKKLMLQFRTTTWTQWHLPVKFEHDRTNSLKKINSTMHLHVEEPLQWIQTLPLLAPLQRTLSGIMSLFWEILEYSEEENQMYTTKRQIIDAGMSERGQQSLSKTIFHQSELIVSETITY